MSYELSASGLHCISMNSRADAWKDDISMSSAPFQAAITYAISAPSWFVAYLDYRVMIGTWHHEEGCDFYREQPDEALNPHYIQRLRVFNCSEEVMFWRSNGTLKGRIRRDDLDGDKDEAVLAHQVLFGTRIDSGFKQDGFTRITEDRGTSLILPFTGLTVTTTQRVCLKTYNYIEENTFGQVGYAGCRFAGFTDGTYDLPYQRRAA